MAHAGDSDMTSTGDGRRGGMPTAGVHDAVAVAVNHQRGRGDSTQLGGAIARLVDGVDLPCDAVTGRLPQTAVPGPRRVLGGAGLVEREPAAREVAYQP